MEVLPEMTRRRILIMLVVAIMMCGVLMPVMPVSSAKKPMRVVLIGNQKFGDQGPMDDMNSSLQRAAKDFGVQVKTFEALQPAEYEEVVRAFARQGYDLIMVTFAPLIEAVSRVAPEFPNTKFAVIFALEDMNIPNVRVVSFSCWEAYFTAGVAAGLFTETGKLAHIAGADEPTLNANFNAFVDGAKSVRKDISVDRVVAGTFEDPAKGKEIALSLYERGIDIIATDAAKTSLGVIEAGEQEGKFVIGDAIDHSDLAPATIIMDTLVGFGNSVYTQVEDLVKGKFTGGLSFANLSNGGVGVVLNKNFTKAASPVYAKKMPQVEKEVEKTIADIISGKVIIERKPTID
jgi:basic membrane protein A